VVRQGAASLTSTRAPLRPLLPKHMKKAIQGLLVLALLAVAAVLVTKSLRGQRSDSDGAVYFYDLSEKKLFAAPRSSVPPIRGINNTEEDAVRAIVIATNGNPREKKQIQIAYLEKYTPELKAQIEALRKAEAAGQSTAGMIASGAVPKNTLVRRLTDADWVLMTSLAGERIVSEWNQPGPDGRYPAVCVP